MKTIRNLNSKYVVRDSPTYILSPPLCKKGGVQTGPCTGVIGGDQGNGPPGKYGATDDIMARLRQTDKTNTCSSGNNLGWYTKSGGCGGTDSTNNSKKMRMAALTVGNSINSTGDSVIKTDGDWKKFPLQALHKVWGDGGTAGYNHGVNCRNVTISPEKESVNFTIQGKSSTPVTQNVVAMETHGDLYTGDVPGLISKKGKTCPKVKQNAPGTRVGGVACTRDQFGGGVYNILCYVPKTTDTRTNIIDTKTQNRYDMQGRGYTFAAWTFHYEEIYNGPKGTPPNNATNSQARGVLTGPNAPSDFPCYNICDGGKGDSSKCTTFCSKGDGDKDLYSTINHEIDIEIPCNSPQFEWGTEMTWDTMNCNTWVNDIDNYDADTGAYYTQMAAKNNVDFISNEPESSTKKDYHWYTIDWFVKQ